MEKGASSTNTHICCRRACSSTLPFFAQQLEETGLVCKAAAPKKGTCSRPPLLIVNFMLLEFLQLFNVCYSITELIFFIPSFCSPPTPLYSLQFQEITILYSKKTINNNHHSERFTKATWRLQFPSSTEFLREFGTKLLQVLF